MCIILIFNIAIIIKVLIRVPICEQLDTKITSQRLTQLELFDLLSHQNQKPLEKKFAHLAATPVFVIASKTANL